MPLLLCLNVKGHLVITFPCFCFKINCIYHKPLNFVFVFALTSFPNKSCWHKTIDSLQYLASRTCLKLIMGLWIILTLRFMTTALCKKKKVIFSLVTSFFRSMSKWCFPKYLKGKPEKTSATSVCCSQELACKQKCLICDSFTAFKAFPWEHRVSSASQNRLKFLGSDMLSFSYIFYCWFLKFIVSHLSKCSLSLWHA